MSMVIDLHRQDISIWFSLTTPLYHIGLDRIKANCYRERIHRPSPPNARVALPWPGTRLWDVLTSEAGGNLSSCYCCYRLARWDDLAGNQV